MRSRTAVLNLVRVRQWYTGTAVLNFSTAVRTKFSMADETKTLTREFRKGKIPTDSFVKSILPR